MTCRTFFSEEVVVLVVFVRAKERRTRGESSASTERARWAVVARWAEGKGMCRVLW